MHAVLGTVTITDYEHARRLLHDDVLPTITDVPGFVVRATGSRRLTAPGCRSSSSRPKTRPGRWPSRCRPGVSSTSS